MSKRKSDKMAMPLTPEPERKMHRPDMSKEQSDNLKMPVTPEQQMIRPAMSEEEEEPEKMENGVSKARKEQIYFVTDLVSKIYDYKQNKPTSFRIYDFISELLMDPVTPMPVLGFCHFLRAALFHTTVTPIIDLRKATAEFEWTLKYASVDIHGDFIPVESVRACYEVSKACADDHWTYLAYQNDFNPGEYKKYLDDWYDHNGRAVRDMMEYFQAFYEKHYID